MKANELRIGNFVNYEGKSKCINLKDFENFLYYPSDDRKNEPIPITKEWLIKFGFVIDNDFDNTFIDNTSLKDCVLIYDTNAKMFIIESDRDTIQFKHIKHVHQLQNLYFALTQKELIIKE